MIHIYCGDGKGKTTASVGLCVRAAGRGKRVVFTQFFKDGSSGEVKLLKTLPGVTVLCCPYHHGFYFRMNEEQKERARQDYTQLLEQALSQENTQLLVLDEVISACGHHTVPEERLLDFLRENGSRMEIVLTGRNPSAALLDAADYVTRMEKVKHPFDRGIPAREGVEY